MIVYLDTSALVKRYLNEPGSHEVHQLFSSGFILATSALGYAEAVSAFCRRRREGSVTDADLDRLVEELQRDWPFLQAPAVGGELNSRVESILRRHPLRGGDAVHLATAVDLLARAGNPFAFACADSPLRTAAAAEGFTLWPGIA